MRKKSFIYWGAILLTIVVIGVGAALLGRDRGPRPSACLPKPGPAVPYLFVERIPGPTGSEGSDGPFGLVHSALAQESWKEIINLNSGVAASFLVAFGEGAPGFWAAAVPGRESLERISSGKLPESWAGAFEAGGLQAGSQGKKGSLRIIHQGGGELFLRRHGSLLLIAEEEAELDRMEASLAGRLEPVKSAWRVKPSWMGHLRADDAGKPGLFPILPGGVEDAAKSVPVTIEAAWRHVPPYGGEGAWMSEGVGRRLAEKGTPLAAPVPWNMKLSFPRPLAMAVGVMGEPPAQEDGEVSGEAMSRFGDRSGFWKTWTGLPEERVRRFLKGPIIFSVGGSARAMGLPTPGFLVEFPGRREEGPMFVRSLLGERWGISSLIGREVNGFDVGGAIPLPFTIMAAANGDTALVGYLEPESLGTPVVPGGLSAEFNTPSVAWLWIDGEALSGTLDSLAPGSPGFRLLGLEEKALETERLQRLVNGLGKLAAVMETAESGHFSWSGVEPQGGQP